MVVTRLEYPLGENVPYMIMSLDTMISVKNTVNIGIVRSKIKDELKKTYSFLPVSGITLPGRISPSTVRL